MSQPAMYGDLARYYDKIYSWKDYETESRRLARLARKFLRRQGTTLLDVACGTGRHLEQFRREFSVEGVDLSREMLSIARGRLGKGIPLTQGDMRTFRLGRGFDVLVCLFSAIGYMRRRTDRDRAIANFYRHIAPGGVALVEGWVRPSRWRGDGISLDVYDGPDCKIARATHAFREGDDTVLDMHYLIAEPRRPVRHLAEEHHQVLVEPKEMLESFRTAGFRAKVLLSGPYRDRGMYVGIRPPGP
jgi:ubiquinone/menaquinone biosynthesis C-methylase UbiE